MEYKFLKAMYQYLTKQDTSLAFKNKLFSDYSSLVNVTFSGNREEPSKKIYDVIEKQMQVLLEAEYTSCCTFMAMNNEWHYQRMQRVIKIFRYWGEDPEYYGYADYGEFFYAIDAIRKQFNSHKIDIPFMVGKYPKENRKRFEREPRQKGNK